VDAVAIRPVQHDLSSRSVVVGVATFGGEQRVDDCSKFVRVNRGAGGPLTPGVERSAPRL
jgi:hypothetical protein